MRYVRIIGLTATMAFALSACTSDRNETKSSQTFETQSVPIVVATNTLPAPTIEVYKDASCGCCKEWIKHLEQNGFKVEAIDMPDLSAVKTKYGVKPEIQACHTAVVNGYVVEGHVPADVILKMLKDKPAIVGLAVPGMPMGSPGMEGPTKERYDVLTFDRAGRTTVYAPR
ncbi:MAG: DUF411 domain-containing protein [Gemmatimonadales bacterium]